MSDVIGAEVVDDHVLVITIDRPEVRNAIDTAVSLGLRAEFQRLDADDDLRVGVLTGAGGTFCSGMDLRAFAREGTPKGVQTLLRAGTAKPLVAALEGVALGGGLASKQLIWASQGTPAADFWAVQRDLVLSVFASEDAVAFAERRPPAWRNR